MILLNFRQLWKKISGAYRVNLKSVFDSAGAVGYISKYITKTFSNTEENKIFYLLKKRKFSFSKNLFQKEKHKNNYVVYDFIVYHKSKLSREIYLMVHEFFIPRENISTDNLFLDEDLLKSFQSRPPNRFYVKMDSNVI